MPSRLKWKISAAKTEIMRLKGTESCQELATFLNERLFCGFIREILPE
jgi:hypothetical protein